jgi:hypothetical protein
VAPEITQTVQTTQDVPRHEWKTTQAIHQFFNRDLCRKTIGIQIKPTIPYPKSLNTVFDKRDPAAGSAKHQPTQFRETSHRIGATANAGKLQRPRRHVRLPLASANALTFTPSTRFNVSALVIAASSLAVPIAGVINRQSVADIIARQAPFRLKRDAAKRQGPIGDRNLIAVPSRRSTAQHCASVVVPVSRCA